MHAAHTTTATAATAATTATAATAATTTTKLANFTHTEVVGLRRVLDEVEEAALGNEALSLWVWCLSLKLSDARTEDSELLAQSLLTNQRERRASRRHYAAERHSIDG